MTPENLEKGSELSRKIESQKTPIERLKKGDKQQYHNEIILANFNNSISNIGFKLKKEQLEILSVLILSMAEQNLKELVEEFENL